MMPSVSAEAVRPHRQEAGRTVPRVGLVVAANREHRMAVIRVDASGQYCVVRWSHGNGPGVGHLVVGELERTGAGPLFDSSVDEDIDVLVVAHHCALEEAIEVID